MTYKICEDAFDLPGIRATTLPLIKERIILDTKVILLFMIDIKNESMYLYNCYFRNGTALFRYSGKLNFEYKDVLMYFM